MFGNPSPWIADAVARVLERTIHAYPGQGLDIALVSHGRSNSDLGPLLRSDLFESAPLSPPGHVVQTDRIRTAVCAAGS